MGIRKLMLVDDEPDIRTVAEMALGAIGRWQVQTCASGAEALARAAEEPPDLILLDMMMPDMDGEATMKELAAQEQTQDIPVIFMTARVQTSEVARYRALGAKGVIAKPFDPMTLSDQILHILGGRTSQ